MPKNTVYWIGFSNFFKLLSGAGVYLGEKFQQVNALTMGSGVYVQKPIPDLWLPVFKTLCGRRM